MLRDQKFAELTNDISDVFLDNCNGLSDEALNQQVLCLDLIVGREAHPQGADDLSQVNGGELSNDLLFMCGHEHEEELQSAHSLKELLKERCGLLDCVRVRLLELCQDVGKTFSCDVLQHAEVGLLLLFCG